MDAAIHNLSGRSQDFFSTQAKKPSARSPRPAWPRAGVELLGRGSQPPPHHPGVWGSAVSSRSEVRGRAPTAKRFSRVLSVQNASQGSLMLFIVPCKGRICSLCSSFQGKSYEKQSRRRYGSDNKLMLILTMIALESKTEKLDTFMS